MDYYRVMICIPAETQELRVGANGAYWYRGIRWITWVCEDTLIEAQNAEARIRKSMSVEGVQIINPFNVDEHAEARYNLLVTIKDRVI